MTRWKTHVAIAAVLALTGMAARNVDAACNLIPGTTLNFAGTLGATNRPFAAPGEPVEIHVRSCDTTSPGFAADGDDHVVSVVFKPAAGGTGKLVALSTNCGAVNTGACPGSVCKPVSAAQLALIVRDGVPHLRFPFPDTDAELIPDGDDHVLAGPAAIAVTKVGESLPCGLRTGTCGGQSGLTACVDTIFFDDGNCGEGFAHPTFTSFTALPVPNDYEAACYANAPPCDATATDIQLAVDGAGNLLVPYNWTGILPQTTSPVPRILVMTMQPPTPVGQPPLKIPSQAFLASYTPEGGLLPPIFEPQSDPNAAAGTIRLFGTADAPYTVLRLAKRVGKCNGGPNNGAPCTTVETCAGAPCDTVCVGGGNDGNACTTPGQCPGPNALCGSLFDVASAAGTGALPVPRLGPGICQQADPTQQPQHADCNVNADCPGGPGDPCVFYALESQIPVPLDGLVGTNKAFFFVVSEAVGAGDLNGDVGTDTNTKVDDVITLRDRDTGEVQPIGNNPTCGINLPAANEPAGRAIVTLSEPPFVSPAVSAEGDVVAFLESEPEENQCDANDDGDRSDAILRVFNLDGTEVTAGQNRAVDPGLLVNGHSLAVSNGLVFVRTPENATGVSSTIWASVDSSGVPGNDTSGFLGTARKLSVDGRYVVFSTYADNLVPNQPPNTRNVVRRDLVNSVTEAADLDLSDIPVGAGWEGISPDGNFVSFLTHTAILGFTNGFSQLYLRDMVNDVSELVSVDSNEVMGNNITGDSGISADNRYVVFASTATNLAAPCNNGKYHIFLRDRSGGGTTQCLSVNDQGAQGDGDSNYPQISADGRIIVYESAANNLDPTDVNPSTVNGDIFMLDRATGVTTLISRESNGSQLSGFHLFPLLSADGRFAAFDTYDASVCPNGGCAVVKDLQTGVLVPILRDMEGDPTGDTGIGSISADGRYATVYTSAGDVVPGDTNNRYDVFVVDRLSGVAELASVGPAGVNGNNRSYTPWLSDDGRVVVFQTWASNLVPDDTVATCNPDQDQHCVGGSNDGVLCTLAGDCPGGTCEQVYTDSCMDILAHRVGPADTCGDSNVDPGEDCDPPGGLVCPGSTPCSSSCHCADNAADLTGDGSVEQTVLQIVNGTTGAVTTLCPAEQVAVGGGTAAFLRPESAGSLPSLPGCPGPFPSLNSPTDGDATDTVVQLSVLGGPVQNLGRGATAVALGATCSTTGTSCSADSDCPNLETCRPPYLAALVSEPQENGSFLNAGDSDGLDTVLNIYRIIPPAGWQPIAAVQAADSVDMKGNLAVYLTPEAAQNGDFLNGDSDANDRVLRIHDATVGSHVDFGLAAEEFVLGAPALVDCGSGPALHQVVAFRTREAAQGPPSLNNDTDTLDDVLNVIDYDVAGQTGTLIQTGRAVTPCPLEACDPRFPYRVSGKTVKFLTRESDQGNKDLNGDDDANDLVLNTIDVCTGAITPIATVDETQDDSPTLVGEDPLADPLDQSSVVISQGGRCLQGSTTLLVPATCVSNAECPPGATCTATPVVVATALEDLDGDGVSDRIDNCPPCQAIGCFGTDFNPTQVDADGDGVGDACDAKLSGCAAAPLTTCKEPTVPFKSVLQIKDKSPDKADSILWRWKKGEDTQLGDFGNPVTLHDYAFCLYAGATEELVFAATAPAADTCAGKPCWKATGTSGFKYKDKEATPLGLTQVKLKRGVTGKAQVQVKGKGDHLVLPDLGAELALPIVAQLQGANGQCFTARHELAGVTKNTEEQFKGKGGP